MRVAIAEDSIFRNSIRSMLEEFGFEVTAVMRTADELLAVIDADVPDIVMLDIRMPPTGTDEGIRAAEQLRQRYPELGIVIFSVYVFMPFAVRLLENVGSRFGYLSKEGVDDAEDIRDCLVRVARGETVLDPHVMQTLLDLKDRRAKLPLTDRERTIVGKVAEGYSNAGIASELNISVKTVDAHLTTIFKKLGVPDVPAHNRRVLAVLEFLRSEEGRKLQ